METNLIGKHVKWNDGGDCEGEIVAVGLQFPAFIFLVKCYSCKGEADDYIFKTVSSTKCRLI